MLPGEHPGELPATVSPPPRRRPLPQPRWRGSSDQAPKTEDIAAKKSRLQEATRKMTMELVYCHKALDTALVTPVAQLRCLLEPGDYVLTSNLINPARLESAILLQKLDCLPLECTAELCTRLQLCAEAQ